VAPCFINTRVRLWCTVRPRRCCPIWIPPHLVESSPVCLPEGNNVVSTLPQASIYKGGSGTRPLPLSASESHPTVCGSGTDGGSVQLGNCRTAWRHLIWPWTSLLPGTHQKLRAVYSIYSRCPFLNVGSLRRVKFRFGGVHLSVCQTGVVGLGMFA
jgi:hypothetical protein